MRRLFLGLVGVGVCLFVAACSGTTKDASKDSGGTCGNTAGCGGNIVGTWKIASSCVTIDPASMMNMDCPGETTSTSGLKYSGTMTYAADLTYTTNFTVSGSVTLNVPGSCLTQRGVTLTCDQLTQLLSGQEMMMGTSSGSCSAASGGGCACKIALSNENNSESGTYTTTGAGALTLTPANGTAGSDVYCVKGSTLTVSPSDATKGTGTLTLTKQ